MEDLSDEELVRIFNDGDNSVYEILFKRYYKKVYSLCYRFCNGDSNLAEETTQETFIQVYQSLGRFKFNSSFYTWLYRVTFNTCSIAIKKAARLRSGPIGNHERTIQGSDSTEPSVSILKKEKNSQVSQAVADLPEDQKQVMILGPIMGHSYQEISDIIGESITVIKGRLFRARQNFKTKFKKLK
ncbi:MAG: sigma-70 family RNA polymerase sigma factor [Candidatus Cloacimonetes bacterium]|nr:sigma-70 family RNA polymerase sigma factor [Candidatus Cloacimonadota bacterium]